MDKLQQQVTEVKQVMRDNVERVLERGERVENLLDRSTDLEQSVSELCFLKPKTCPQ